MTCRCVAFNPVHHLFSSIWDFLESQIVTNGKHCGRQNHFLTKQNLSLQALHSEVQSLEPTLPALSSLVMSLCPTAPEERVKELKEELQSLLTRLNVQNKIIPQR